MITRNMIDDAQERWAKSLIQIGELKGERIKCVTLAAKLLDELYAFESGEILFKPTKAGKKQFRPDKTSALSYFIGGDKDFVEDNGFALVPWKKIRFDNRHIILETHRAIVMGNYFFTDISDNEVKVEYTFGYKLIGELLKIDLHHSSLPYKGE